MSNKFKIITATLLTIALIFGGTLNFSEAAAKSTDKIIANLKTQVKKLTASNKSKDKEIAKLKEAAKKKDSELANLKKDIKFRDKDYKRISKDWMRLNKELSDTNFKYNMLKQNYVHGIDSQISDLLMIQYMRKGYCNNLEPGSCTGDIKIETGYILKDMISNITKQKLKEIVISSYRSIHHETFVTKNIIIELTDGNYVVPVSSGL